MTPLNARSAAVTLLAATALLAGCAAGTGRTASTRARSRTPSVRTANVLCPISGMPVGEDGPVLVYRGVPIGFCCTDCLTPWRIMSDAERAELVHGVAPQVQMRPRDPFR